MNFSNSINNMIDPVKVTISDMEFAIYPFPAFKAANLSGEIMALLLPMMAALIPMITKEENVLDTDMENAASAIAGAFNSLSGDKVEQLLKKLLTDHGNIATEIEDEEGHTKQVRLTEKLINEYALFSGDIQDMFILAFHVLKVNYAGFFSKIGNLSGTRSASAKIQSMFQDTAF